MSIHSKTVDVTKIMESCLSFHEEIESRRPGFVDGWCIWSNILESRRDRKSQARLCRWVVHNYGQTYLRAVETESRGPGFVDGWCIWSNILESRKDRKSQARLC